MNLTENNTIMKEFFSLLILIGAYINCIAQELVVTERLHSTAFEIVGVQDKRYDANGIPCAIVKVQLPVEKVVFEGNIVHSIYKTNEYWLYITAGTKMFRIKCPKLYPLDIDIKDIYPSGLVSNQCYAMKLSVTNATSDIEGKSGDVIIKEYFVEDFVTRAFCDLPINNLLKDSKTTYETVKALGLNPTLSANGDVNVFMTKTPEKCKGFNAVKMQCKVDGCDIIPEQTSMGYEPSKYDDGRITYQFSWPHANDINKRKMGKTFSMSFAKFLLQSLIDAGYKMEGNYIKAKCVTDLGEITLVCNDNYGSCWVGLYVDTCYKLNK